MSRQFKRCILLRLVWGGHTQPRRRIAVRLQPVGHVAKRARVRDVAREQVAGKVRDLVGKRVPDAGLLLGLGVGRRRDGVPLLDQRVEVDHLEVVVEEGDDDIARQAGRQGGDGCEGGAAEHFGGTGAVEGPGGRCLGLGQGGFGDELATTGILGSGNRVPWCVSGTTAPTEQRNERC